MRVLVACKRGTINPPRDRHGHCLCVPCQEFNKARYRRKNLERAGYKKQWERDNPEKLSAYAKKWIAANKGKRRLIEKAWRLKNPDKVAQMSAKAGAKWSQKNRGRRNAITAARRAAIRLRLPDWADRDAIKRFYDEAAQLTVATGIRHEVDHIYPLQGERVSGLHVASNLQVLSISMNRAKKNLCAV